MSDETLSCRHGLIMILRDVLAENNNMSCLHYFCMKFLLIHYQYFCGNGMEERIIYNTFHRNLTKTELFTAGFLNKFNTRNERYLFNYDLF